MKISQFQLFVFIFLATAICVNAQSIEWLKDFDEASRISQESGKPMLLDFTASWCKPCQQMEKTFWTRSDIIELSKNFVAVKVNFDNERSLTRKYFVSAIPNVTTTDPWGNSLNFSRGFGGNSENILEILKSIPKDFSPVKQSFADIEIDKNNLEALTKISDFYTENKFYYQSNEFNKRILKLETNAEKRESLMLTTGFNYIRSGLPDEAENYFDDFEKEFPNSKYKEVVSYGLVFVEIQKKKVKSAGKMLENFRNQYPNSKYIKLLDDEIALAKNKKD